jgi:hypothetical protein
MVPPLSEMGHMNILYYSESGAKHNDCKFYIIPKF